MKVRRVLCAGCLALASCSSNDSSPKETTNSAPDAAADAASEAGKPNAMVIFTWWQQLGEVDALEALVNLYQRQNPGESVEFFRDIGDQRVQTRLDFIDKARWDIVQFGGGDLPGFLKDRPGSLAPLDTLYKVEGLDTDAVMDPKFRDVIMVGGHPMGVVTGVHRNNAFFCNKQILDEQGMTCPTTIDEMLAAAEKLLSSGKAGGYLPFAVARPDWCARFAFDEIMAGVIGAQEFADLVANKISVTDRPELRDKVLLAIDTFDDVIKKYSDRELFFSSESQSAYDWNNAADDFHHKKAAMMFHGDWAAGYIIARGGTSGVDFVVQGPPGAADLFVYGADTLTMTGNPPHPDLAQKFIKTVASKEGQIAFNAKKGSTPMRVDVRDMLDGPAKARLDELANAQVKMSGYSNALWDEAMKRYIKSGGDKSLLVNAYLYGDLDAGSSVADGAASQVDAADASPDGDAQAPSN